MAATRVFTEAPFGKRGGPRQKAEGWAGEKRAVFTKLPGKKWRPLQVKWQSARKLESICTKT
ncbi:hypothetical protein HMPREF0262_01836 [Clostridium sp. ATCC 29733]|nr:hypothetical protein HMPREF0262_01836 [Clostridium sp. ATCC 29733]